MVTLSVIGGNCELAEMVFTSGPAMAGLSGMAKLMVSLVGKPLETLIASRKVHSVELQPPVPGSAVELTVKVTAWAGLAARARSTTTATRAHPRAIALLTSVAPGKVALIISLFSPLTLSIRAFENSEVSPVSLLFAVAIANTPSGTDRVGWKVNKRAPFPLVFTYFSQMG